MGVVVGSLQPFHGDVRVNLCGGKGGVTEKGLDAAEVGPGIEHVCGETVAELVRGDVEWNACVVEIALEREPDRAGGEAVAALVDEKRAAIDLGGVAILLDGLEGEGTDRDDALLTALAEDADSLVVWVNGPDFEAGEF